MHVSAFDTHLGVVLGKILSHALGQRGHQDALFAFDSLSNLVQKIVDLAFDRSHLDFRIDQSRRTNDLLDDGTGRFG
jgi:hypothetical protein